MKGPLVFCLFGAFVCAPPPADPFPGQAPKTDQTASAGQTEEIPESKRELLRLINNLKPKLPPELSRRLAVISMKIATRWCSPYLAADFERDVNARPAGERQRFEKEWKLVRAHEAWPCLKEKK